jgi:penicillin-binding protein 2
VQVKSVRNNHKPAIETWRLTTTYLAIFILLSLFVYRLYNLQILQNEDYVSWANENRFERVSIPAPRGVIYDRNGYQLVRNIPSFNIVITPALLPDSEAEKDEIFRFLAELTGVPEDQEGEAAARCIPGRGIRQFVAEGESLAPFDPWPIACDVDETIARIVNEASVDMPGVGLEILPVRDYTTGKLTASIIGYLGPISEYNKDYYEALGFESGRDKVGYAGIEGLYQDLLSGSNGQKLVETDVAGQILREVGTVIQPTPGNNLRLSIDTRLQAAAETALEKRMEFLNRATGEENHAPIGVVIAINPQTGEILAMVSLPTYENNRLARFIPELYYTQLEDDERGKPLINHAISDRHPPGSTFKLATAIGALNEGIVTPSRKIIDHGSITIQNKYFPNDPGKAKNFVCWKEDGHGEVDFIHGIAFSCNVYFYKIGGGYPGEIDEGLGIDRIGIYARALGYGNQLGIDLPAEVEGLIPTRDWKRRTQGENWSTGDTYNATTGQGYVLATPLQVLNSVATIANGGKVMWPHIVTDILDGEGNVIQAVQPCVLWDITDNIITPSDQIGANCPQIPESLIPTYDISPDIIVEPWVIEKTQEGLHLVVTEGTASDYAQLENISSAGKTGTGEFCDTESNEKGLCIPGAWPTHAWYAAYAPFENPEIAVVAFIYNGGEGAVTSGPIVKQVLEAYFAFKSIDTTP